jgi:aminoglycoside 2'-N-acetyltransferase I
MSDLRVLRTEELDPADVAALRPMLDAAFRGRFEDPDWDHAMGGVHVVIHDDGELVAHAAVVERWLHVDGQPFRTGYLEAVAATPDRQGEGFGDRVAREATRIVEQEYELGGLSTAHHRFYERMGWERWLGPTYVREGDELVRTEDEDDGVMVLRFGPSATTELAARISCESRPGDDW